MPGDARRSSGLLLNSIRLMQGHVVVAALMKISIVVPAFNEEKLLPATLRSITSAAAAFHARGWETELIVCDNNSTDRTAEVARAGGAQAVFEPVNQISRARNTGAAAATGGWLVFVDADSQPSRELFAEAAAAMMTGRFIGGGVTVRLDEFFPSLSFFTALWNATSRIRKIGRASCRERVCYAV